MSRRDVLKPFEENRAYMEDMINTGIERNRKGYAEITVKDSEGNPVKDVQIKVNQKTHEFKYGANLFMLDELETEEKNNKYKELFEKLKVAWKDPRKKAGLKLMGYLIFFFIFYLSEMEVDLGRLSSETDNGDRLK